MSKQVLLNQVHHHHNISLTKNNSFYGLVANRNQKFQTFCSVRQNTKKFLPSSDKDNIIIKSTYTGFQI